MLSMPMGDAHVWHRNAVVAKRADAVSLDLLALREREMRSGLPCLMGIVDIHACLACWPGSDD